MTLPRTDQPLAEVVRDGDRAGLHFVRVLAHPREKVWRALTESEHLRHWLPADLVGERRAGARLDAVFWPDVAERFSVTETTAPAEILVWEPPRRWEWTWGGDLLQWRLDETPTGTRLTLTAWPDPAGPPMELVGPGYHLCLAHLEQLLDTGDAPSVAEADPAPLETRYAAAWEGRAGT